MSENIILARPGISPSLAHVGHKVIANTEEIYREGLRQAGSVAGFMLLCTLADQTKINHVATFSDQLHPGMV